MFCKTGQVSFDTFEPGDSDLWPSDTKLKGSLAAQDECVDKV